jgi:hypothetical protein
VHLQLNLPNNSVPFDQATALAQANTTVTTQNARPFPSVGQFSAIRMAGHSSYHALQVSLRRQYSARLAFIVNYTRSKSINDGDGLFSFSQPTGLNVGQFPTVYRNFDRAVSEFDRPNNFTAAAQYHTPGPRWLRDIEINPIVTARDGLPTTINQNNLNPAASQLRPNVISNTSIYLPNRVPNGIGLQYLAPATSTDFPLGPVGPLFTGTGASRTLVLPAGIGTLGRNTVRTPGEFDIDLAVGRKFPLRERLKIELRAEAFNLLNHTNLLGPDTTLSVIADSKGHAVFNSPSFGLITAARAARFMQLVTRFEF